MRARYIALIGALLLAAPSSALANGDPASDVLLQVKVYFPNQQPGKQVADELSATVEKANAKGYPIRVALIRDPTDLGTVPDLLNQPQKYAEFLGPEIQFAYKGDLLVVMPNGLGLTTTDQSQPPAKAIAGMKVEAGGSSDGLALTATEAVTKLAAAAGHPLVANKKGGGGGGALAGIIVAVALLGAGLGAAIWLRKSQAPASPAEPDQQPSA